MTTTLLRPDAVVLDRGLVRGAGVLVRQGTITAVGDVDSGAGREVAVDGVLLPGAVDLQVNGAGGRSVDETTPDALDAVAAQVWRGGAAAFLPTLITAPFDVLLERVAAVSAWIDAREGEAGRAEALGLHVEGPFLESAGVHDPDCFVDPTPSRLDALLGAAGGRLALVTLAPGRRGAPEAVARLRERGVAVALGHAHSTDGLDACLEAGASLATHLFNAMGPMHHREPGLAGHALDDSRLSCSLVPDGAHVHEVMLRNAWRCLGPERTVLVSDSVAAAGMPDGSYRLGGTVVHLRGGVVRDDAGRLAGSALTMDTAARSWMRMVRVDDPCTLARVLATNPARILRRDDLGRIAPEKRALFGIWHPERGLRASRG